jgi:transcriptional regulator with XRE-family HTH domain
MKKNVGNVLKFTRVLLGLQQSEIANFLGTQQAIIAQIEAGRQRPNPEYSDKLSKLFFINYDFLRTASPPIFFSKVNIFTLPPLNAPAKITNQIDIVIRKLLPVVCSLEKINDVQVFSSCFREGTRERLASVFFLLSDFGQLIIFKIIEDKERLYQNLKSALSDFLHHDTKPISYYDYKDFFLDNLPLAGPSHDDFYLDNLPFSGSYHEERSIEQFDRLLSKINIPLDIRSKYVSVYRNLPPNPILFDKEEKAVEEEILKGEQERNDVIKRILKIMSSYAITPKEIADFIKKEKAYKKQQK